MIDALPPLPSLLAFVLVAETGSLAAAAAKLNVTQPAVSKRIRLLEAHLGVALIRRGANRLRLTPEGEGYAAALDTAFAGIRQATAALALPAAGPLRVRAYTTWAMRWLIPRLPRFRALHPGLEVEVTTSVTPVDFSREKVDAAIRTSDRSPAPGAQRLHKVTVAPFATPALARRAKREGLAGMTLLGSVVRPQDWRLWAEATGTALPATPLYFESTSLAIQAALEGLGAAIAPPLLVTEDVRRRRLVALAQGEVSTEDDYWLVLPPGPARREALAFRDWLMAEVEGRAG